MNPVPVTVFSDFTCPFSYVAETLLRRLEAEGEVRVAYRAFELYPAPDPPAAEAVGIPEPLRPLASEAGIVLRPPVYHPRTGKAHESSRFAREHGREEVLRAAIFAAYWEEGEDIGRIDVLSALAEQVDLDPVSLKIALDIDRYTAVLARERAMAERIGLSGVPALILGEGSGARLLLGAHSDAALRSAVAEHRDI